MAQASVPENSMSMAIVLLGAPGSGKGTQAAQIAARYSLPHISTGDLFRENIAQQTPVGREAKSYIDGGKLVPDGVVEKMLFARIALPDAKGGFVLDGFPRTVTQAEQLAVRLQGSSFQIAAFNLEVSDNEVIRRLSGRRVCPLCKESYHMFFKKPQRAGLCDKDSSELVQRGDDTEQVIAERLTTYHAQTKPLIGWYQTRKQLHTIDGEQPPEQVFQQLVKAVDGAFSRDNASS